VAPTSKDTETSLNQKLAASKHGIFSALRQNLVQFQEKKKSLKFSHIIPNILGK
jgi:hypothetical protein